MRIYLLTEKGDSGPYTPAQINRMFVQGEVTGQTPCHREGSSQVVRLDEIFRHMRPRVIDPTASLPKLVSRRQWITAWVLLVIPLWMWTAYFQYQPMEPQDFTKVTGTMQSATESAPSRSGSLMDIQLQGNAANFRIWNGPYERFRRDAFFSEVPANARMELTIPTADLSDPHWAIMDWTPGLKSTLCGQTAGITSALRTWCNTVSKTIATSPGSPSP
jgi:hypothetical protein